jgi:hypothetical protein
VSIFVWLLPVDLSGMDDPTSSYAIAGIGLRVSGAFKPATTIRRRHHRWSHLHLGLLNTWHIPYYAFGHRNTREQYKTWTLLIMLFCPSSCYFPSLMCKYSPQHFVNSFFSFQARDQDSFTYTTTCNIILFCISIFRF